MWQIAINGFIIGCELSLFAIAFALIYNSTRIFSIGLAGIYCITPFMLISFTSAGIPWPASLSLTIAIAVMLSAASEAFNHFPLMLKGDNESLQLISSLGIFLGLSNLTALIWGENFRVFESHSGPIRQFLGITLEGPQLITLATSVVIITLLFLWIRMSRMGLFIRAIFDNGQELEIRGHSLRSLRLVLFGISGGLCAMASLLSAYDTGFNPHGSLDVFLLAVVATIIGGRSTFLGPLVGSLIVGTTRSIALLVMSGQWQNVFTFIVVAGFLIFRPKGLFGTRNRLEAEK